MIRQTKGMVKEYLYNDADVYKGLHGSAVSSCQFNIALRGSRTTNIVFAWGGTVCERLSSTQALDQMGAS